MNSRNSLRRVGIALVLLVAFLVQGTWALAGTTGGLSGVVTDESGKPVAGATVTATSPSGQSTSTTDAGGHYNFLSLAPDSYTVSVVKTGFNPVSAAGITVFADQNQHVDLATHTALKEIGNVTSRAATDIVQKGVTTDTYAVSAAQAQKVAALGGGGSLDSAYSAVASVPGLVVPVGQAGWNQAVYIRGAQADTTGYEYDGVPVNRAFDNYAAHTATSLGQAQLQVYTGGGPASVSSSGIGGFINQVIRTGTYPGFGTINASIGGPTFYHELKAEAGGASPNRNFSYYAGLSGYDQDFRYGDQNNEASLSGPFAGIFSGYSPVNEGGFDVNGNAIGPNSLNGNSVAPLCNADGTVPAAAAAVQAGSATPIGCFVPWNGFLANFASNITDRENVINLHFGIPHRHDSAKDDVQLLVSASALRSNFYSSPNDLGPGINQFMLAETGAPYCPSSGMLNGAVCAPNFPNYVDATIYNAPFGTPISTLTPVQYFQPSSNTGNNQRSYKSEIPANNRDLFNNDTGIIKLQYTHPLSDRAYIKAYGYTFFSDWTQAGATNAFGGLNANQNTQVVAYNYDLITHTAGGELQFADQINDQNLLQLTTNYTTANVVRFNNTGFLTASAAGGSPVGLISRDATGQYHCYARKGGAAGSEVPCIPGSGYSARTLTCKPAASGNCLIPPAGTAAALAGAQYVTLWDGGADGTYNTVGPRFSTYSITDEFKPNAKLTFNVGLRDDNYLYKLNNTVRPANDFYTQIVQKYACYSPTLGAPQVKPPAPGQPPTPTLVYTAGACNAGYIHPGPGSAAPFSDQSPSSYTLNYLSPSISGSYSVNPDTVLRFSAKREAEPPISAAVQYDRRAGTAATSLLAPDFLGLGFTTPFHAIPGQVAWNYDASLEHHFKGTDVSLKLTPYYRTTLNWSQDSLIGQNFVTHIPVATAHDYGLEAQLVKGDFNRNGFSGELAYTYTHSKVQFHEINGPGSSQIEKIQQAITDYNTLATGPKCFNTAAQDASGANVADPTCANPVTDVLNPYFGAKTVDPNSFPTNGWYDPYTTSLQPDLGPNDIGNYIYPHNLSLILNYRHDRFAVTPSLQFQTGTSYGTPLSTIGIDPRVCTQNQGAVGNATIAGEIASGALNPLTPDATSCYNTSGTPAGFEYVPNPETHNFDAIGAFRNPSILTMNAAFSYDLSSKVTANLQLTNLYHRCFGGSSTPWTSAFPPGGAVCGYALNGYQPSNFFNGTSPHDVGANGSSGLPTLAHTYVPTYGSSQPFPFAAYFSVNFKI